MNIKIILVEIRWVGQGAEDDSRTNARNVQLKKDFSTPENIEPLVENDQKSVGNTIQLAVKLETVREDGTVGRWNVLDEKAYGCVSLLLNTKNVKEGKGLRFKLIFHRNIIFRINLNDSPKHEKEDKEMIKSMIQGANKFNMKI